MDTKVIRRICTASIALALMLVACGPRAFSYTVLTTVPEPGNHAEFRDAIRNLIRQKFARSHVAVIELSSMESLNRDFRHCRGGRNIVGCRNVGNHTAVIIDTIRFVSPDTAYAKVQYFVSELSKPTLAFTIREVRGIRSPEGVWRLKENSIVTTGTMY